MVVPVRLVQYGDDKLVSRSQAKILLVRVEKFRTVMFDFDEVETIGQAFADEIFLVFKKQHPDMELVPLKTNKQVQQMISRALARVGVMRFWGDPRTIGLIVGFRL